MLARRRQGPSASISNDYCLLNTDSCAPAKWARLTNGETDGRSARGVTKEGRSSRAAEAGLVREVVRDVRAFLPPSALMAKSQQICNAMGAITMRKGDG